MKGVKDMRLLVVILVVYVSYLMISVIWSEYKKIPMLDAMGEVAKIIYAKIRDVHQILFKEQEAIIIYPTYIGYDSSGMFYPYILMDEFTDLKKIFDGLYFTHRNLYQDIETYHFKFARILEEGGLIELTRYTDTIVEGIVTNYLGRIGCCAIPNVSAVEISKGELCIGVARTQNGQAYNEQFKKNLYINLNKIENQSKTEREPIEIMWNDLIL